MSRSAGAGLLLVLAVAAGASACQAAQRPGDDGSGSAGSSGEPGAPITGPAVIENDDGVSVVIAGHRESNEEAIVSGTLAVVSGCLGLEVGSSAYVVLWPSGSALTGSGVRLPDGKTLAMGDRLEGVGGFYEEEKPLGTPDLPEGCDETSGVVVVVRADN